MKYGYFRQDESSHWYLIPEEVIIVFDAHYYNIINAEEESEEWNKLIEEFIEKYGLYATGGGVKTHKVLIPE